MVKTSRSNAGRSGSIPGLGAKIPTCLEAKKPKQKQYCKKKKKKKFNEDFKNGPHRKKKNLKKKGFWKNVCSLFTFTFKKDRLTYTYIYVYIRRIFLEGFSQAGNSRDFRVNRGQGNCIKGITGGMSIISVRLKKNCLCIPLKKKKRKLTNSTRSP